MTIDPADWGPTASMEVLRQRARMLQSARDFFARLEVLEVETPAVSTAGVTDPHITNVSCRLATHPGDTFYLQTSAEYAMKRLLAAGSPDIYQICKVFRDGELGNYHQPEFTMIEWYRKGIDLPAMIDETCALIATLQNSVRPTTDREMPPIERQTYRDLFMHATGLDPLLAPPDELSRCATELTDAARPGLARQLGSDRNAWLDFLMSHVVTPNLPRGKIFVVYQYPAQQAALARLDPADERFAERFEIFFGGLELANGYRELTDPQEQRRRFQLDCERRRLEGLDDIQPDEKLLAALDSGLPDCCGVAVGFDRLVMSINRIPTIAEALSFGLPA